MKGMHDFRTGILLTLLLLPGPAGLSAQSNKANPTQADRSDEAAISPAQKYFTDVVLVNQDGQPMRFYSDLLKGRCVVIDVFFTNCEGVCPVLGQKMAAIQDRLGERLGKDLFLISISVDPATDTPPRLKEYAKKFHAKPGWYFLTGKKENVDFVLQRLGQSVEVPQDHTNILLVGNEHTGLWKKAFGLARAEELVRIVEGVLNDKGRPAPVAPKPAR